MSNAKGATLKPHSCCVCPTPIKGLGCLLVCVGCEGGMSQLGTWVGGWVGGFQTPPPGGGGGGGVGHLSVCGYAKILGGWVPELTPRPPPPWLSKTLVSELSNAASLEHSDFVLS